MSQPKFPRNLVEYHRYWASRHAAMAVLHQNHHQDADYIAYNITESRHHAAKLLVAIAEQQAQDLNLPPTSAPQPSCLLF